MFSVSASSGMFSVSASSGMFSVSASSAVLFAAVALWGWGQVGGETWRGVGRGRAAHSGYTEYHTRPAVQ